MNIKEFVKYYDENGKTCKGKDPIQCTDCVFYSGNKVIRCGLTIGLFKSNVQNNFINYENISEASIKKILVDSFVENYRRLNECK